MPRSLLLFDSEERRKGAAGAGWHPRLFHFSGSPIFMNRRRVYYFNAPTSLKYFAAPGWSGSGLLTAFCGVNWAATG